METWLTEKNNIAHSAVGARSTPDVVMLRPSARLERRTAETTASGPSIVSWSLECSRDSESHVEMHAPEILLGTAPTPLRARTADAFLLNDGVARRLDPPPKNSENGNTVAPLRSSAHADGPRCTKKAHIEEMANAAHIGINVANVIGSNAPSDNHCYGHPVPRAVSQIIGKLPPTLGHGISVMRKVGCSCLHRMEKITQSTSVLEDFDKLKEIGVRRRSITRPKIDVRSQGRMRKSTSCGIGKRMQSQQENC